MGVYDRPDSPWWWLYLETTRTKEKTAIRVGTTQAQRHDSRLLAEDLYHRRMNELAAHIHKLPRAKPTMTFDAYATWYDTHVIAHHRGAPRERELLKTLRATFGPLRLREITADQAREWRTARTDAASASTSNRELDLLKAMLRAAVPTYLEESPIVGLKRLRSPRRETRILSRGEEKRLLRVLPKADRAIVICALDTLMRLSDVMSLTRAQDRGRYLVVVDPKVKPYKVPVSARLRKALDGLPKNGPYYFAHRRTAKKLQHLRSTIKNMLKRACAAATPPIPYGRPEGLTFHCLRHTGATRLSEAGVPVRVIQELGGWQSGRQLDRYCQASELSKQLAVEQIGTGRRYSQFAPVKKRKRQKRSRKQRAA